MVMDKKSLCIRIIYNIKVKYLIFYEPLIVRKRLKINIDHKRKILNQKT